MPSPSPRWLSHLPGKQKYWALRVGIIGAYVFRGLALLLAQFIIENPWLKSRRGLPHPPHGPPFRDRAQDSGAAEAAIAEAEAKGEAVAAVRKSGAAGFGEPLPRLS